MSNYLAIPLTVCLSWLIVYLAGSFYWFNFFWMDFWNWEPADRGILVLFLMIISPISYYQVKYAT